MDNFYGSLNEKIEKVLQDSSEYEINLGSDSGRLFLVKQIMKVVVPEVTSRIKVLTSEIRYLKNEGHI